MKSNRETEKIDQLMAGLDMKNGTKKVVEQYGRGMLAGMHLAYVSVARKLLSQGESEAGVRRILAGLADREELDAILADALGAEE